MGKRTQKSVELPEEVRQALSKAQRYLFIEHCNNDNDLGERMKILRRESLQLLEDVLNKYVWKRGFNGQTRSR